MSKVQRLFGCLDSSCACVGNPDDDFLALPSVRNGVMKDHSSKINMLIVFVQEINFLSFTVTCTIAVVESARTGVPSIYHVQCAVLVPRSTASKRCAACTRHRKSLASLASRAASGLSGNRTHPSSHTPYSVLTTPEKDERLRRLRLEATKTKEQLERLRQRVASLIDKENTEVDDMLDGDLHLMVKEHESEMKGTYPEGSFQRVFWDEQVKASTLKDKRSMK